MSKKIQAKCVDMYTEDTIEVQAVALDGRTVSISWESEAESFEIYRAYPGEELMQAVQQVTGTIFVDRLSKIVCRDTVRYRIVGERDTGFVSVYVSDDEPTAPPSWGVVTIDSATQQVTLRWNASRDTDILGYLICEGVPSSAVDTVFGRENCRRVFPDLNERVIYHFRLCAFDSCRQTSELLPMCNNIYLTCRSGQCSRNVEVKWSPYKNMPGGLGHYELWVKRDAGLFQFETIYDSCDSCRVDVPVGIGERRVCVFIKAISATGEDTSFSNRVCVDIDNGDNPDYLYLRKVSIYGNRMVYVEGQTDSQYPVVSYGVYRRVGQGSREQIASVFPDEDGVLRWSGPFNQQTDKVYSYGFSISDGCGGGEIVTRSGAPIVPTLIEELGVYKLKWDCYEGWTGRVTYDVMAYVANTQQWMVLGSTEECEYSVDAEENEMRYKIVAKEGADSQWKRGDSLQSSEVLYKPTTHLWIPNSFTPTEEQNNIFQPIANYIADEDYSFVIYDRKGNCIFSTSSPMRGWDGTARGVAQPQGVYVYMVAYRQRDGSTGQRTGTVLLIR